MPGIERWISSPAHYAKATRRIHDTDGTFAKRGDVGEICDYLPEGTSAGGYVVVDWFKIDLAKIEVEKRAMLEALRSLSAR